MNKKFEQNILNIYGSEGKNWLANLPNIIKEISRKWGLRNLKPAVNLSMNYILSGFKGEQKVILKLSADAQLIENEYEALKAFRDYGAVQILGYQERAMLLEELSPAVSLKTYLPDRRFEALKIACEVAKRLSLAPLLKNTKLPTIEERFNSLNKDCPIPQDYLILARKFRDELFLKKYPRTILHGDLHHDNILLDGDSWRVIDPHGVIGFPINEVWAFVQNIEEDIPYIANYFDFSLDDLKKCYFMHIILSAVWAIEDNMDPLFWLDLAKKALI